MKYNMFKNKWAITIGIIIATIDFILLGGRFIYVCAIKSPICGEGWVVMLLHRPTIYLFQPLLELGGDLRVAIITAIAGLIQYFIAGYILGFIIFGIKKILQRLF